MVTERSELTEALIEVIAPLEADDRRRVDASLGRFDGRRVHVYGAELRIDKRPANLPGRAVGVLTTSYELSAGSRAYRRAPDRVSTVSATKLHLVGLRSQGGTRRRTVGGEVVAFVRGLRAVRRFCRPVSIYADVPLADGGWFTVEVHDGRQRSGEAVRRVAPNVEAGRRALEQALARAVGVVLTRLRAAAERPNQIEVEFGVKLSTSWLRSSRARVARPASGSPSAGIASEAVA